MAGATVLLQAQDGKTISESRTDSSGDFHLAAPDEGQYVVELRPADSSALRRTVTVSANGAEPVQFVITRG